MEKQQEDFEPVFEGMSFSNIDCKGFPDSVTISNGKDLYHFETREYVPLERDYVPLKAVEELIEKATPKKSYDKGDYYICPNCSNDRCVCGKFCPNCGQALDWSL